MDKVTRTLSYVLTAVGGVFACTLINMYAFDPTKVYEKDIDRDGKKDIVVECRNGREYEFIKTNSGTYVNFEDVSDSQKKSIESKLK